MFNSVVLLLLSSILTVSGFCLKFLWELNNWKGVIDTEILMIKKDIQNLKNIQNEI